MLLITCSCNYSVKEDRQFTGARFVEVTSDHFLPYIVKNHLLNLKHPLQKDIIELCQFIDTVNIEMLIQSGGYNPKDGEFMNGTQKELGLQIINKHKLLERVAEFKIKMYAQYEDEDNVVVRETLKELKEDLYIITNYWNKVNLKEFSVITLSTDLTFVENKLIFTEIKLREQIKNGAQD
ncbi:MAG: hypothetical protein H7Z75_22735 [Ferruginibacter sp.]|nr:hypothetical protein [Cytophagales bacterium]